MLVTARFWNIIMCEMRTPYFRRKPSLLEFGCKVERQAENWQHYAGDLLIFLNLSIVGNATYIEKLIVVTFIKWANLKTKICVTFLWWPENMNCIVEDLYLNN